MRFVGVDLAWTLSGSTGLCLVDEGRVRVSTRLVSDTDVLAWLRPHTQDDVVVAVDAPLIVRNATGRRPAEQVISRCFGAYHASAHSANLGLPSFRDGVRGERLAMALDLDVNPVFPPRTQVRRAIEVYPHTAIVALFELSTTLKYKGKKGRTVESRAAELTRLLILLESLRDFDPPLDVAASPRWAAIARSVANASRPAELDRLEDEIDAYVCAYTALYYWSHGTERCRIAGSIDAGYIVTPVTEALGDSLDRISAELAASAMPGPLARDAGPRVDAPVSRIESSAARVRPLLPDAIVTRTPNVVEFAPRQEDGIVVLVTAEAFEIRLPTIEWTGGTHGPAPASRLWQRLHAEASTDELSAAVAEAETERAGTPPLIGLHRHLQLPTDGVDGSSLSE